MEGRIEPRTLSGVLELLPNEQIIFNEMMDKIKKTYEKFGFLPIDTPIIELSEILLAKAGGETEKQIYRFNKGDNDLSLRFDLTVPLAKYVSLNQDKLVFPFRRYQIGKVYRGERPQKCRFREFYQCDVDIIGTDELDIENDAEMVNIIYETFKELKLGKFTICINNRKVLNGLFEYLNVTDSKVEILRIIDKIEKIGKEKVLLEIEQLGISNDMMKVIDEFISIEGTTEEKLQLLLKMNIKNEMFEQGLQELRTVFECIKSFGVPEKFFDIDFKIARGLDYYTGTVYETFFDNYKNLGSVCSGGRYDNLTEYYSDKKMQGVGISIGLTRLYAQLKEMDLIKESQSAISKVLIINMGEETKKSFEIAKKLRDNNINAEIYFNKSKGLKAKFKYADRLNIPYVFILGEEEITGDFVTVKNMKTGEQKKVNLLDILAFEN